MELCRERRGENTTFNYLAVGRVEVTSELPLAEVLFDFYDRLKTVTQGYGSFDYEMLDLRRVGPRQGRHPGQQPSRSTRCHNSFTARRHARQRALHYCDRLKPRTIPRQNFKIAIQGDHRRQDHRALDDQRVLRKGRHREVLRRRHQSQAQAPREAEGGQEADEDGRERRDPADCLHRGPADRREVTVEAAGLYVHVPFCARVCPYCDFAVTTFGRERRLGWLDGVVTEASLYASSIAPFDTLYIGGGTPSLLEPADLARLLAGLRSRLDVTDEARITLEANPEDVTPERAREWCDLGVQTVSLGCQSFDDLRLARLGRRHRGSDGAAAIASLRTADFDRISIDLMHGLAEDTVDVWRDELARAIELRPEHISCYQLTVHDGTHFGRLRARGDLTELDLDRQAEIFLATHRLLADAGYDGYEVSNFALETRYRSRHNQKYWHHTPYLGLGPSAHSFDGTRRWWNHRTLRDWETQLSRRQRPVAGSEELSAHSLAFEALMLQLRTRDGVDLERFAARHGVDLEERNSSTLARLEEQGLITRDGGRVRPTLTGLAVSDRLARDLDV